MAFAAGTITSFIPISLIPVTKGKTPLMLLNVPSSDNSPKKAVFSIEFCSTKPASAKIPIAIGKSKLVPSFFISAGAKFTITFITGKVKPEFLTAERTLSRASLTAASGNPTIATLGSEFEKSTSTSIL